MGVSKGFDPWRTWVPGSHQKCEREYPPGGARRTPYKLASGGLAGTAMLGNVRRIRERL